MAAVLLLPAMFKHGTACIIALYMLIFRFRLVADGCFTIRKLKPDLVCRQINLEQNGIQQLKKYS
nr:MAG TPA: hypothetical protein [Caudoviricetes sp.]